MGARFVVACCAVFVMLLARAVASSLVGGTVVALLVAAACGSSGIPSSTAVVAPPVDASFYTPENYGAPWLYTDRNRILNADGSAFKGRGANLMDTRSCDACTDQAPDASEVIRRADTLIDDWHATFVRFLLESYGTQGGRTQWQGVLEDPQYFADIQTIVQHFADKKTYVLVTLWSDPTFTALGWPTAQTTAEWVKLAQAFQNNPYVMYGIATEPADNLDGSLDAQVWTAMNATAEAIRAIEPAAGPHHLIAVQGTGGWARRLDYYVSHPITAGGGANIVYEEHFYNSASVLQSQLIDPAQTLPVFVGEFGPENVQLASMTIADCTSMMDGAEANGIPWLAWSFHFRCDPNLLVDTSDGGCGIGVPLVATDPFGTLIKTRLATAY